MTEGERLHLKSQLTKAIDEVVNSCLLCISPVESLQSVTEAARAYAELDGPLCLSDIPTAELVEELNGRGGVDFYVTRCTEVVDTEEEPAPSDVA